MPKAVTILIYLLAEVEVINNQLAPKLRFFVILMSSTNVYTSFAYWLNQLINTVCILRLLQN